MCLIVYKPAGVEMPSKNILKRGWLNNPDGAGWIKVGKTSQAQKGFMSFKKLWKNILAQQFTRHDEVAIHFRVGTSGGNGPENTHPFPITDDLHKLKKTKLKAGRMLMHNGILGAGNKDLSDTMIFVKEVLFLVIRYLDDPKMLDAIANMTKGSRLLLVNRGKVTLTGSWVEDNGIFYSNDSYKNDNFYYYGTQGWNNSWDDLVEKYGGKNSKRYQIKEYVRYKNTVIIDTATEIDDPLGLFCPLCGDYEIGIIHQTRWGDEYRCYNCSCLFDESGNILD